MRKKKTPEELAKEAEMEEEDEFTSKQNQIYIYIYLYASIFIHTLARRTQCVDVCSCVMYSAWNSKKALKRTPDILLGTAAKFTRPWLQRNAFFTNNSRFVKTV